MKHSGLAKALKEVGVNLHQSRLNFLSMLLMGIVEARTVNLKTVVGTMQSWSQQASVYRRAQRFFAELELDETLFTSLMVGLLARERYTLCVDRTNWKFGRFDINILMIAVADEGVAIPLAFVLLTKRDNSNTLERTGLLEQVLQVIEAERIEVLLADREFIGQDRFEFLIDQNIPFAIRMRENSLADGWFRLSAFFQPLKPTQTRSLHHRYRICGCDLSVAATRSPDQELVIIVTNRQPSEALAIYAHRWQLESLFKALKSSGFNLEDTHLKDIERLSALIAVVSLAFLWALRVGHWQHRVKPIRIKPHGRREVSVFRLGLDFIRRAIANLALDTKPLDDAFRLLSCT